MAGREDAPITVPRRIGAPASEIFRVLANPGRHRDFDGSGMLRGVVSGQMYFDEPGTLGLLGVVGGTALAYLAVAAWAYYRLSTALRPVPATDLIAILAGLLLAARHRPAAAPMSLPPPGYLPR